MRTSKLLRSASWLVPIILWPSLVHGDPLIVGKATVYLKDSDEGKAVYEIDSIQLSSPLDDGRILLNAKVISDLLVVELLSRATNTTEIQEWQIPASVVSEIRNPIQGDWQFRLEDRWRVITLRQNVLLISPATDSRRIYQTPKGVSISALSPIAREHRILLYTSRPGVDNAEIQVLDTKSKEIVQSFPIRSLSFGEALLWLNTRFALGVVNSRAGLGVSLIDLEKKAVVADEHFRPGTPLAISDGLVITYDKENRTLHQTFEAILR